MAAEQKTSQPQWKTIEKLNLLVICLGVRVLGVLESWDWNNYSGGVERTEL